MNQQQLLRSIRIWLAVVITGLALSGVTAFPLASELALVVRLSTHFHLSTYLPHLAAWLLRVHIALDATNAQYPFLAYGTDWLAFAHLIIAVVFIGPWLDPVRNRWVITFGLIACLGIFPLALIAGPLRGIPVYWRLIDCSFGLFGAIPLLICRHRILQLKDLQA